MRPTRKMALALIAFVVVLASVVTIVVKSTGPSSASPADVVAAVQRVAGSTQATAQTGPAALPILASNLKPALVGNTTVWQNAAPDTSFVVRPSKTGMQTLVDITGNKAPSSFAFSLPLPPGARFKLNQNGSVSITSNNGKSIATLAAPWAKDANGKTVATHYAIRGNEIVQTVNYKNATFPVIADPWVSWHWWGYTIYFSRWETQVISWGIGAVIAYFGWTGWAAVAAYAWTWLAGWAIDHGYCLEMNYYWGGSTWAWAYRC